MGPLFVDWTTYRAAFEARASEILGQPVHVAGTADMRLIPIPTLDFTDVEIGPDPKRPMMKVARFELEVELFPLLSGEVDVTSMRLQRPEVTVALDAGGATGWAAAAGPAEGRIDPSRVTLANVEIVDGRVVVADARRPTPLEITGIDARLDARSLIGPYKIDGAMVVDGEQVSVRASTGTREADGSMVLKLTAAPADRPVSIALDGRLSAAAGVPRWAGKARVERVVAADDRETMPWAVEADVELDPARLLAKDLAFRYGPEDRPFSITGATTVDLVDPPYFEAVLSARQIDLDRTLGKGPEAPVSFQAVLAAMRDTLATLPRPPIDGRIGFDIPGVVVGGGIVSDLRLDVAVAETGWTVETLEAGLPGRTTLVATGDLVTDGPIAFEGSVAVQSEQPATLVGWWLPERPKTTLDAFSARAQVEASATGLRLANLDARLREARVTGAVGYVPAVGTRRPRVSLDLAAGAVDADQVAALAGLVAGDGAALGGADLTLSLTAEALAAGDATARKIDVAAGLADGVLRVDRLSIGDLAGARVAVSGEIRDVASTPDGSIQARLSAERLDGVARLVAALAPDSEAARMLAVAAPVLAPAMVEATVTAARSSDRTRASVTVTGDAGGSSLDGSLAFDGRVDRWREATVDLKAGVRGPDGVRLMRQLGIDVPGASDAGATTVGSLAVVARGRPADGLAVNLDGHLGPTRVAVAGTARAVPDGDATAALTVSLASPDVGPILALGGGVMGDLLASTPADLSAAVAVDGPRVAVDGLKGVVAGQRVAGDVAADFSPAVPALKGTLALETASLAGLGELALGPGTLDMPIVASRSPWPEAPFGPTVLDGVDADLALSIGRVDLGDGLVADDARFALRASASGVGFDGISARLAGGRLTGNLVVKQDLEGTAALNGTLRLDGADAGALVWRSGDRPVVTGTAAAELEVAASGRTVAGLVSSATGGGSFAVADGRVRSFNPHAFAAVIRAADAGQPMTDDRIAEQFTAAVDAADLPFARLEGTFTLAGGTLRAPAIRVTGGPAELTGTATVDLPHDGLASDWTLVAADVERSAGSPPPQAEILFRGPLDAPTRKIDVAAFSNFLGIRSFERETERVLLMQADILERELLTRTVLRGREAAERRVRAEEERRRAEAERAAAEEAARLAAEAERAAAARAAEAERRRSGGAAAAPDDFGRQIEQRLQRIQPGTPAPAAPDPGALPGVSVQPPPAGTTPPPG